MGRLPGNRQPIWRQAVYGVLVAGGLLALLEGLLAVAGVEPYATARDPYLGFAASQPLFVEAQDPDGNPVLRTALNRRDAFNLQSFARHKPDGSFRIFCLGGSTTHGRPYRDSTSFCGWLREFLAEAQPERPWEVINAGGISYASYRVAQLMDELVGYAPDLFIVYSGHNEFLERRTYGPLLAVPEALRSVSATLARTRLYTVLHSGLESAGALQARPTLGATVEERLDFTVGPTDYHRDDALREQVVVHYLTSIERMVDIAQSAGSQVVFVVPASNLKDQSPFKSEHEASLSGTERARWQAHMDEGERLLAGGDASGAAEAFGRAVALAPRHADGLYRQGRALLAAGRPVAAAAALAAARDEDVAPLRMTTPLETALREVTERQGVPLLDFEELVEAAYEERYGHRVPGKEWFLDHLHPTPDAHRELALALFSLLQARGWVSPGPHWDATAIEAVTARVEAARDPRDQALALRNLGRVMGWAGKLDEAHALLLRALDASGDDPGLLVMLGHSSERRGRDAEAEAFYRRALAADATAGEARFRLGRLLARRGRTTESLEQFRWLVESHPDDARARNLLGVALEREGLFQDARVEYERALALDPGAQVARGNLANLLARNGEPRAAAGHYQALVEAAPDNMEARVNLGAVLAGLGQASAAREQYAQALRVDPGYVPGHLGLAGLAEQRGEIEEAEARYRRTLRLAPGDPDVRNDFGAMLARRGRLAEAEAQFRAALRLAPEHPEAGANLRTVNAHRGQPGR